MLVHFCCWRRSRLCLTSHWKERASGSCRWIPPDSTCGSFFYDLLNSLPLAMSQWYAEFCETPDISLRLKWLCPVEDEDLCFNLCGRTLFFFACVIRVPRTMQKMILCPSNTNKHTFVHSSIHYMFYRPISARVPGPMEEAINWLNRVKRGNFVNGLMGV